MLFRSLSHADYPNRRSGEYAAADGAARRSLLRQYQLRENRRARRSAQIKTRVVLKEQRAFSSPEPKEEDAGEEIVNTGKISNSNKPGKTRSAKANSYTLTPSGYR